MQIKMNPPTAETAAENKKTFDTLLPLELTHVPGIIDAQTAYTEKISVYPNRRTAFVGALAMLSFASGRWYRTDQNMRTNEYFVAYAKSGAGKDAPRKVCKEIAIACGCARNFSDSVGSGEGLQDALLEKAKFLLINDEFDTILRAIAEDKSGSKESLVRELLTDYSTSGNLINKRTLSKALERAGKRDVCIWPHLTLLGSTVGQYLFETLNDRVLENGLMARCLMVDCGSRQARQRARYEDVPLALAADYREVMRTDFVGGVFAIPDKPDCKNENIVQIPYTEEAFALNEELQDGYDAKYAALDDGQHAAEQSFLARTNEHMTKMAMLYAISENHREPAITADALRWADAFVTHCQTATLANVRRYTAANPHEANVKRVLRMLEKRSTVTRREITKNLRLPMATVEEVIEYMLEAGYVSKGADGVYVKEATQK